MSPRSLPRERWARMERRLRLSLRAAGVDPGSDGVTAAFGRAMEPRHRRLPDEDDYRYLHPGRVVLILLGDLEERDPGALAAGALAETRDVDLRAEGAPALPQPDWWGLGGGISSGSGASRRAEDAAGDREGVPEVLRDRELLEALVTAPVQVQRLALAEALDQVRHAHLWSEAEERARAAALAEGVFLPFAGRVRSVLERRFRWWVGRVGPHLAAPGGFTHC